MADAPRFYLTISCPDVVGVVSAVSTMLTEANCFITESNHFGDPQTNVFFMRTVLEPRSPGFTRAAFAERFAPIAAKFAMDWSLHDARIPPRVLILVSKFDHCLQDLLYRKRTGSLMMEVPAIVSNHVTLAPLAEQARIPFVHLAVTAETKATAEARLFEIIEDTRSEFVVLARYMQVLSNEACGRLPGRVVNIHHSFLPSFKGAKPYHQAFERGVKLVGATAHFVTADLDEGPIIAQAVAPVDHTFDAEAMVEQGRDVESQVLARALRKLIERRVFLNGHRTVVF
ncbi:formyltetrahydrofolate deformylase [Pseudoxanthobacter sp. M-2]|uniref:formyltetrahydrofolate deformylase n=1 Tax=Pseudoxanthobacter sp. M-2 TaxID=3078754 RepID=UPI0038FCCAF3